MQESLTGGSGGDSGSAAVAGGGTDSSAETAGSGGSSRTGGTLSSAGTAGTSGDSAGTSGASSGSGGEAGKGGGAGAGGAPQAGAGGANGSGGASGSGGTGGDGGASGAGGSAGRGGNGAIETCAKNPIPSKSKWTVTASSSDSPDPPAHTYDDMLATRWTTGKEQTGVEWLQIDFGVKVTLTKLTLQLGDPKNANDYPRKYVTRFSNTSMNNAAPVLVSGMGAVGADTVMAFPAGTTGRYVLINQTGTAPALWWSVGELQAACAD